MQICNLALAFCRAAVRSLLQQKLGIAAPFAETGADLRQWLVPAQLQAHQRSSHHLQVMLLGSWDPGNARLAVPYWVLQPAAAPCSNALDLLPPAG